MRRADLTPEEAHYEALLTLVLQTTLDAFWSHFAETVASHVWGNAASLDGLNTIYCVRMQEGQSAI